MRVRAASLDPFTKSPGELDRPPPFYPPPHEPKNRAAC
jgi:hypothetical protein